MTTPQEHEAPSGATRVVEDLEKKLAGHWIYGLHCDHETKTDTIFCACGWTSNPQPSVGHVAASWAQHALREIKLAERIQAAIDEAVLAQCKTVAQMFDDGLTVGEVYSYLGKRMCSLNPASEKKSHERRSQSY